MGAAAAVCVTAAVREASAEELQEALQRVPPDAKQTLRDSLARTGGGDSSSSIHGAALPFNLLTLNRPADCQQAVDAAFLREKKRDQRWAVDGAWSYDFVDRYASPESCGSAWQRWTRKCDELKANGQHYALPAQEIDVINETFERIALEHAKVLPAVPQVKAHRFAEVPKSNKCRTVKILDIGAGKGEFLARAAKAFDSARFPYLSPVWHGITGGREVPSMDPSFFQSAPRQFINGSIATAMGPSIASTTPVIFQSVALENAGTIPTAVLPSLVGGQGEGYDLILSSWTWRHLSDPLGTLELYANLLAVGGEMHVNTFTALFEEGCHANARDGGGGAFDMAAAACASGQECDLQAQREFDTSRTSEEVNVRRRAEIERLRANIAAIDAASGGAFELAFACSEISTEGQPKKPDVTTGHADPGTISFDTSVRLIRRGAEPILFADSVEYVGLGAASDALKHWNQSANFWNARTRAVYRSAIAAK